MANENAKTRGGQQAATPTELKQETSRAAEKRPLVPKDIDPHTIITVRNGFQRLYHLFSRRVAHAYRQRICSRSKRFYEYDEGVFVQSRGFNGLALMMIQTTVGVPMDAMVLNNYFRTLINLFFKILPIKESGESSLDTYMRSLQAELLGCKELIEAIHEDPLFLSLIAILQYLIDNPSCEVSVVKREVFRAISICNKLKSRYAVPQEVSE